MCLHNPKPHKWWELGGPVKKFPLTAEAEIIGPRFSQSFWHSHLEPSFDLHDSSHQTACVWAASTDSVTYFVRTLASFQVRWFFSLDSTSVDDDVYGKHVVSCDNPFLSSGSSNSGVWIDPSGCQDFVFCICLKVKGQSSNNDLEKSMSGHRLKTDLTRCERCDSTAMG